MSLQVSVESRQYVKVPVIAERNGVVIDPTIDPVQMAFPAVGEDPVTWYAATWETDAVTSATSARCLVGPGGTVELAVGFYDVYVKITDSPEEPVLRATDVLEVF